MGATSFPLEVSHGQIAVFASAIQQPFNDWTDRHVAQGFAWRAGSASFRALVEAGTHLVQVVVADQAPPLSPSAIRAIEVPFEIPPAGAIEIASISDSVPLSLSAGVRTLRCEFLGAGQDGNEHVRFVFAKFDMPRFEVIRADDQLSVGDELLTTAEPASI